MSSVFREIDEAYKLLDTTEANRDPWSVGTSSVFPTKADALAHAHLTRALALACALDRELAYDRDLDVSIELTRAKNAIQVIMGVLSNLIEEPFLNDQQVTSTFPVTGTLVGIDRLSPSTLANQIAPFLQAILDMEAVLADLQNKKYIEPKVYGLSQNSPISIGIDGAAETISTIKEELVPWRREHAKKMAELKEAQAKVKIREIETRISQTEQTVSTDEERASQIERQRLENERLRLENERVKWELDKEHIMFAMQIIDKFNPNLAEDERMAYAMRLLEPLFTLTQSPLEITEPQRPSTLPEMD